MRVSFFYQLDAHVSSTIVLIFRTTVLTQHLVSSLSTCFEHYCAHLQEDNCINTASGIVTLYMFRVLLYSSSGGQLY